MTVTMAKTVLQLRCLPCTVPKSLTIKIGLRELVLARFRGDGPLASNTYGQKERNTLFQVERSRLDGNTSARSNGCNSQSHRVKISICTHWKTEKQNITVTLHLRWRTLTLVSTFLLLNGLVYISVLHLA